MKDPFTTSEKRVIRALIRLDRPANANEVSNFAEMSWAVAKKTLAELKKKRILLVKTQSGKKIYKIREGIL